MKNKIAQAQKNKFQITNHKSQVPNYKLQNLKPDESPWNLLFVYWNLTWNLIFCFLELHLELVFLFFGTCNL